MDWKTAFLNNAPYIGLMAADQRNRSYLTRLMEQATPGVLVGLTVAALGVWKSDSLQDQEIHNIKLQMVKNENQQATDRKEMVDKIDMIAARIDIWQRELYDRSK
jgi:hypothetical protein